MKKLIITILLTVGLFAGYGQVSAHDKVTSKNFVDVNPTSENTFPDNPALPVKYQPDHGTYSYGATYGAAYFNRGYYGQTYWLHRSPLLGH